MCISMRARDATASDDDYEEFSELFQGKENQKGMSSSFETWKFCSIRFLENSNFTGFGDLKHDSSSQGAQDLFHFQLSNKCFAAPSIF